MEYDIIYDDTFVLTVLVQWKTRGKGRIQQIQTFTPD